MEIIILDSETTGLNFLTDEIIQCAAIRVDVTSGIVRDYLNIFMEATGKNLDAQALQVNGYYRGKWKKEIKDDRLVTKRTGSLKIIEFLKKGDYIFSHNSPFDKSFVTAHIFKNTSMDPRLLPKYWFDTATIAFLFKYYLPDFKAISLDYCSTMFKVNLPRDKSHDALQDCMILKDVFFKMMKGLTIRPGVL